MTSIWVPILYSVVVICITVLGAFVVIDTIKETRNGK